MPTIADVAKAAGVSTATVSRVLNGNTEVDPVLAARVRETVASLNYRPSRIARSLRTRRTSVWSLIISDIRNPFFTDMIRGVEDVAYANDYSLVLCNAADDLTREAAYLQLALIEHMAGVILAPASDTESAIDELMDRGVPVVTVDRKLTASDVDRVLIDNVGGAAMAVEHLIESGYRRIGCITGPVSTTTGSDRLAGYRKALRAHRIRYSSDLVRYGDFHTESGRTAMADLLAGPGQLDAVFVANNLMTLGALDAITGSGRTVPDDIAVVGFDDVAWASLLRPPLTTIGQPTYELGARTAQLLLERINGYTGAARELILSPTLQVRASSRPAVPA